MYFEPDEAIGGDVRAEDQPGTSLEAFDGLACGRLGRDGRVIAVFITDEDLALLLVQRQHFGIGENGRVGDLLQSGEENRDAAGDEADLQAAVDGRGERATGAGAVRAARERDARGCAGAGARRATRATRGDAGAGDLPGGI